MSEGKANTSLPCSTDRNALNLNMEEGVEDSLVVARAVLRPAVKAAVSLRKYDNNFSDVDLNSLVEALAEQTQLATDGDTSRAETMLAAQAHTLDAIFNNLAQRAAANMGEFLEATDTYLKLALRAQSQCRTTWETLSAIKNPPVMGYVKQANISHGHQQVNNGSAHESPCAGEKVNPQNELLEEKDGERLDFGATSAAGRTNQDMATVGEIDRTEDRKRQGNGIVKCLQGRTQAPAA